MYSLSNKYFKFNHAANILIIPEAAKEIGENVFLHTYDWWLIIDYSHIIYFQRCSSCKWSFILYAHRGRVEGRENGMDDRVHALSYIMSPLQSYDSACPITHHQSKQLVPNLPMYVQIQKCPLLSVYLSAYIMKGHFFYNVQILRQILLTIRIFCKP